MDSKYLFYQLKQGENAKTINFPSGYSIKIHELKIGCLNLHTRFRPIYVFWYFFSFGRCKIYYVLDQKNRVVHFSHVMPKIFKYDFMSQRNSVHIGPCWTDANHRGKGIYPAVLSEICRKNPNKDIFIFTESENLPSQKGLEKVGFRNFARGFKTRVLGIYKINHSSK